MSRWILAVRGNYCLQRIDVVEYGYGSFGFEEADQFLVAWVGTCGDADEGNSGILTGAGVIHGVPDVPALFVRDGGTDLIEAFGIGLEGGNFVRPNEGREQAAVEAIKSEPGFGIEASGEDGKSIVLRQTLKEAWFGHPLFAGNHAIVIFAEEEFLDVVDDFLI